MTWVSAWRGRVVEGRRLQREEHVATVQAWSLAVQSSQAAYYGLVKKAGKRNLEDKWNAK